MFFSDSQGQQVVSNQSSHSIRYWTELGSYGDILKLIPDRACLILLQKLHNGEYRQAGAKQKFAITIGGQRWIIYGLELDDTGRVLFTIHNKQCVLLDYLPQHEYKKSAFMQRDYFRTFARKLAQREIEISPLSSEEEIAARSQELDLPPLTHTGCFESIMLDNHKLISLDSIQKQPCYQYESRGPRRIKGGPGTGKSSVAAQILIDFCQTPTDGSPRNIVYFSKSSILIQQKRDWYFRQSISANSDNRVQFLASEDLYPASQATFTKPHSLAWINRWVLRCPPLQRLLAEQIFQELAILDCLEGTPGDYFHIRGLQVFKTEEEKELFIALYQDFFENVLLKYVFIEGFKFSAGPLENIQSLVLVDEAQLCSVKEVWLLLCAVPPEKWHNFILLYDPKQNPGWVGVDLITVFAAIYFFKIGRPLPVEHVLTDIYRNAREIIAHANRYEVLTHALEKSSPKDLTPSPNVHSGIVRRYTDTTSVDFERFYNQLPVNSYDWVVITRPHFLQEARLIFGQQAFILSTENMLGIECPVVIGYKVDDRSQFMKIPREDITAAISQSVRKKKKSSIHSEGSIEIIQALSTSKIVVSRATHMYVAIEPFIQKSEPSNAALEGVLNFLYGSSSYSDYSQPIPTEVYSGDLAGWERVISSRIELNDLQSAQELFQRNLLTLLPAPLSFYEWCAQKSILIPEAEPLKERVRDIQLEIDTSPNLSARVGCSHNTAQTPQWQKLKSPTTVAQTSPCHQKKKRLLSIDNIRSAKCNINKVITAETTMQEIYDFLFQRQGESESFWELYRSNTDSTINYPHFLERITSYGVAQKLFFRAEFFGLPCPQPILDLLYSTKSFMARLFPPKNLLEGLILVCFYDENPMSFEFFKSILLANKGNSALPRTKILQNFSKRNGAFYSAIFERFFLYHRPAEVLELLNIKRTWPSAVPELRSHDAIASYIIFESPEFAPLSLENKLIVLTSKLAQTFSRETIINNLPLVLRAVILTNDIKKWFMYIESTLRPTLYHMDRRFSTSWATILFRSLSENIDTCQRQLADPSLQFFESQELVEHILTESSSLYIEIHDIIMLFEKLIPLKAHTLIRGWLKTEQFFDMLVQHPAESSRILQILIQDTHHHQPELLLQSFLSALQKYQPEFLVEILNAVLTYTTKKPLSYAFHRGKWSIVRVLLEMGANPAPSVVGENLLRSALHNRDLHDIAAMLFEKSEHEWENQDLLEICSVFIEDQPNPQVVQKALDLGVELPCVYLAAAVKKAELSSLVPAIIQNIWKTTDIYARAAILSHALDVALIRSRIHAAIHIINAAPVYQYIADGNIENFCYDKESLNISSQLLMIVNSASIPLVKAALSLLGEQECSMLPLDRPWFAHLFYMLGVQNQHELLCVFLEYGLRIFDIPETHAQDYNFTHALRWVLSAQDSFALDLIFIQYNRYKSKHNPIASWEPTIGTLAVDALNLHAIAILEILLAHQISLTEIYPYEGNHLPLLAIFLLKAQSHPDFLPLANKALRYEIERHGASALEILLEESNTSEERRAFFSKCIFLASTGSSISGALVWSQEAVTESALSMDAALEDYGADYLASDDSIIPTKKSVFP